MQEVREVAEAPPTPIGSAIRSVDEFQAENVRLFPTPHALAWFIRSNRLALTEAGALLSISGRVYVDPAKFEPALRQIGIQRARLRAKA